NKSAPASVQASAIRIAESDRDILCCFPCMRELWPHLDEASFLSRVRAQQAESGYTLAFIERDGVTVCVAGFRVADPCPPVLGRQGWISPAPATPRRV
ncbi:MAG: hypothetical protein ACREIA_17445, partial [Opitutaceae bacterium]